jgi:hypothetical protein
LRLQLVGDMGGTTVVTRENFSPIAEYPDCTHRNIIAWQTADTHEPMAFWSCKVCKRRFEPTKISTPTPTNTMISFNPAPKPSSTKKVRGKKTIDPVNDE